MDHYLFDVMLTFSPYLIVAVVLFLFYLIYLPQAVIFIGSRININADDLDELLRSSKVVVKTLIGGVIFIGAVLSVFSPSLLYKNQTFDSTTDAQQATSRIENKAEEFKDKKLKSLILKPDQTKEERKTEFDDLVDWRSRK